MSNQAEMVEPQSDLTAHFEEYFLAEIEADLMLEELDEWVGPFLRERVV